MRSVLMVAIACATLTACSIEGHIRQKTSAAPEEAKQAVVVAGEFKSDISCDGERFTDTEQYLAVLHLLHPRLYSTHGEDRASIRRKQAESARTRAWVLTSLSGKLQGDYLKWLDSFDRDLAENLAPPPVQTDKEKRESEQREQDRRVSRLARCLPAPPAVAVALKSQAKPE